MLNHPVIQDAKGPHSLPASWYVQKYRPPEVGYAEQISAIERETKTMKKPAIIHPYIMAIGPPYNSPVLNIDVTPVTMDTMENEKAKLESTERSRLSSCL